MGTTGTALADLSWVFLDVDGVLTDGSIRLGPGGEEWKRFWVRDGLGIGILRRLGLGVAIISGRAAPAVDHRAEELGIDPVVTGVRDKLAAYEEIREARGFADEEAAFCGDDLTDLALLARVGVSACPADAHPEVREAASLVLETPGGEGAVRELAERIVRARGEWDRVRARFAGSEA